MARRFPYDPDPYGFTSLADDEIRRILTEPIESSAATPSFITSTPTIITKRVGSDPEVYYLVGSIRRTRDEAQHDLHTYQNSTILTHLHSMLSSLLSNQSTQLEMEAHMSAALDKLTREVAETRTAVDSALTLITGLAEQIRANADDESAMLDLADDLDAQQQALAQAVSAVQRGICGRLGG